MSAGNPGVDTCAFEKFIYQLDDCVRARLIAEYDAKHFFERTTQILQLQIAKHMLREFHSGAIG